MFTSKSVSLIPFVLLIFACLFAFSFGAWEITSAQAQAATTWYVTTTGNDANTCSDLIAPCLTINAALSKALAGDTIEVATGTYTGSGAEVVLINKAITLSGGWDAGFTTQSGVSIVDGQAARRGITTSGDPVVVDRFKVQNGNANDGGGIYVDSGTLTINNSTINGNHVNCGGGNGGGIENHGNTILNNSTVSNNTVVADCGAASGINNYNGSVTLNNSTVSGNSGGMAIYSWAGYLTVNSSTVSENTEGIRTDSGHVVFRNSIIAGNTIVDFDNYYGTVTSAGYNLIGNINPVLGPLQDNGGPTFTHALMSGSPALNAGNPAIAGSGDDACLATDQRGVARTAYGSCDIGAFEATDPMIASIKRVGTSLINAASVDFTVTFTEAVTGVDATDFALTTTNITGASITNISGSGAVYTVTVNTGSANGTIRLDLLDDDSIINGAAAHLGGSGNGNGNVTSGETYTIDSTPPTVLSIHSTQLTNSAVAYFNVTFSEPVTGVEATDFILTNAGPTGTSITNVSNADPNGNVNSLVYTVTINTGTGNGTIRLDLIDDDTIMDAISNPLGGVGAVNGNFTAGESVTIDRTPPTVLSITRADSDPTTADSVNFTVNFSEAVTGVDAINFTRKVIGLAGTSITSISGSGATYTVTVNTGTGAGTVRIDMIDNYHHIKDLASNRLALPEDLYTGNNDFTNGETYTINRPIDTNGPLDTTFGVNGVVSSDGGDGEEDNEARAVAIQPNGKIIVVGSGFIFNQRVILLKRYNVNGTLDTTFVGNGNGAIITPISNFSTANSIAIQPDSKIVISAFSDNGVALVRYNANGALDSTFGTNGKVITQTYGFYSSIAIQPNGQIVVAGEHSISNSDSVFVVQRYNSNGSLDTSFGVNGKTVTDFGTTEDNSHAIAIQPDGKIVVAGDNGRKGFAVARYNNNGSLDTSFGNAGKVITNFTGGAVANALALQPDGKIIVTGASYTYKLIAIMRYNSDGSPDKTFDADGRVTTQIGSSAGSSGVVLLPDGKIMVSGRSDNGSNGIFTLLRYQSNGALDTTFGSGGIVKTAIADDAVSSGLAFQPDGKLVVAGSSSINNQNDFALARYNVGYSITISTALHDGWALESTEISQVGGSINSTDPIFNLGDNLAKKQYRGVLAFATGASLPDNAVINSVTLKVKKRAVVGVGDPLSIFQGIMVDIKDGFFGSFLALQASDFEAPASKTLGPASPALVNNWYTINLINGKDYINKLTTNSGLTQIRLRFKLDDNNDAVANYLSLYSGDAPTAADRPQLQVTYYVP